MRPSDRWQIATVADVCRLINGRAYSKTELLDSGRYPVLRVGNFFTNKNWYYSDLELEPDKYCDTGDLLYAWSASFGPRIWHGGKAIFHYHIWKVEPRPEVVDRDFLFYFFEWDKELICAEQGAGATMIHVSKGSMEARSIRVPPLEEQRRIVAVLDQAFAALDRARALAEANLADAEELFASEIAGVISVPPQDWRRMKLGELADLISGQHIDAKDYNTAGRGIGYLTGPSDFGPYSPVVSKWTEYPKRTAKCGDILITVKGSGVGSINMMEDQELAISRQLMAIRVKPNERDFIHFILEGSFAVFQELANGSAIPGISRSDVLDFELALPPVSQLQPVVAKLRQLKEKSRKLTGSYSRAVGDLNSLRQSILQKAFAGDLT